MDLWPILESSYQWEPLPIPLIFNVDMYSEMADSQNSAELGRGIGHFKIATFGRLSGIFLFEN